MLSTPPCRRSCGNLPSVSCSTLADVRVVFPCQHFADVASPAAHRHAIRVVSSAVKKLCGRRSVPSFCCWRRLRPKGKPPPIDFARQIMSGFTPNNRWRRPQASFCAGFLLHRNQQPRHLRRKVSANPSRKPGLRNAQADIHHDRFQNNCRDLARILLEAILDTLQIV